MSLHDEYARVTPFEIAFPTEEGVAAFVGSVADEAAARGVDSASLGDFLTLGSVEAFVREADGGEAGAPALHRFGPVAYHAVRFAEGGRRLFLMTAHVARYLVEGLPDGEPTLPGDAGYVQLPQHLFWTRATADAPESIDGVFWSVAPGDFVHFLLVTGLRPGRPGVGVVPLPEGPVADAAKWLDLKARQEGADFSTDLPGAEIDGLYEIQSAGEVFKLMARFFAYVGGTPGSLEVGAADGGGLSGAGAAPPGYGPAPSGPEANASGPAIDAVTSNAGAPTPSRLDFARVTLGAP